MSTAQKGAGGAGSNGSARRLRVLLVEDSQPDAQLLARSLVRGGFAPETQRVDAPSALEQALKGKDWDLILCDHAMPGFSAPEALEIVKRHQLDIPFIIVSGYIEEEKAVAAMQAGAHDYVMKDRLARLVPAVERELREAEVRRARQRSEADLLRAHEELELRVERRTADLRAAKLKLENVLEERRRLENELLEIAEKERRRIGFDLHDDLGQKLTGVSMMLKGLEQRLSSNGHVCSAEARKIQALVDEVIHHTHNLAHHFGSLDLRGDDLADVLRGLAANVKKMFEIPCAFGVKGALPELPQNTVTQVYKIAQEAVSNAIKHGKATRVTIDLSRHRDELTMTIRNDGLPFAVPASSKDRMGLRIMNYRANTIGATLEIKPLDKGGTLVTCVAPVREPHRPAHPLSRSAAHHRPEPAESRADK